MNEHKILLIEDDPTLNYIIQEELQDKEYSIKSVSTLQAARAELNKSFYSLIISDLKLPDGNGKELLEEEKSRHSASEFIMITAFGSIQQAVETLKLGASDFLTKPINFDHLHISIQKVLENKKLNELVVFYQNLHQQKGFSGIIGQCRQMCQVYKQIEIFAQTDGPVLILGESGTGKELVAQAIHNNSAFARGPFIAVNCASIPADLFESEFFGHEQGAFTGAYKKKAGFFEQAENGTLFLDEIAEMDYNLQAKLLRVLQDKVIKKVGSESDKTINFRLIAATNRDLERAVESKSFREDLFFRLETFSLYLPPLRDRQEDIDLLVDYFIKHFSVKRKKTIKGLTQKARDSLNRYNYPGNVRELMNIIERSVTLCQQDTIDQSNLPNKVKDYKTQRTHTKTTSAFTLNEENIIPLEDLERYYIHYALEKLQGNKRRVASALGIGRKTLYRKLSEENNSDE